METPELPTSFNRFSWAIAAFCSPIILWPLALLLSPSILEHPDLSEFQRTFISFSMWLYPLALAVLARIAFKLNRKNPSVAKGFLLLSAVLFFAVLAYTISVGFN
ncbi:hypothetical protein A4G18_04515 [Pasteurellaceae bacterium Pebbles2]|nr:hypothetical protein [Pasteurellaceae bacterium Pebbles2]